MQFEKIELSPEEYGERIDAVLAKHSSLSRSQIKQQIKKGNVQVNGKALDKASYSLKEGDELYAKLSGADTMQGIIAEDIPLDIIHEDDELIVVNKDAGLVVHPNETGDQSGTLVNAVLSKLKSSNSEFRPGIIHRLDKDTSGVILVAKTKEAHEKYAEAFQEREVEKHYLCLVKGHMSTETGEISAPLKRSSRNRTQMAIHGQGKEAITRFTVLEEYRAYSLLDVEILTGRTHQIRVHMASIGHPVLGDKTYGEPVANKKIKKQYGLKRQFLHAHSIELLGQSFKAELKKDLQEVLDQLRTEGN